MQLSSCGWPCSAIDTSPCVCPWAATLVDASNGLSAAHRAHTAPIRCEFTPITIQNPGRVVHPPRIGGAKQAALRERRWRRRHDRPNRGKRSLLEVSGYGSPETSSIRWQSPDRNFDARCSCEKRTKLVASTETNPTLGATYQAKLSCAVRLALRPSSCETMHRPELPVA